MVNPIIITTSQPRATREGGSKDESLRWEEKPRFIRQKKESSEKKASFFGFPPPPPFLPLRTKPSFEKDREKERTQKPWAQKPASSSSSSSSFRPTIPPFFPRDEKGEKTSASVQRRSPLSLSSMVDMSNRRTGGTGRRGERRGGSRRDAENVEEEEEEGGTAATADTRHS